MYGTKINKQIQYTKLVLFTSTMYLPATIG